MSWRQWRMAALALALLALAGCASTPARHAPATPTPDARAATRLGAYFAGEAQAQRFSGAVLVAQAGKPLLDAGYGFADAEREAPVTPATRFRIGSVTKQFTAFAVLLLQQQGKLRMQDAACRYLPTCPDTWRPITIEQLLTHTAGVPDLADSDLGDANQSLSPEQLLALAQAHPLLAAPGAAFSYSSAGYNALGVVIEHASGMSYAAYLTRFLFEPLGMRDTGYDVNAPPAPQHAIGYTRWGEPAPHFDSSLPYAAGGLASTVEDLLRWSTALDDARLLPRQTLDALFAIHVPLCGVTGTPACSSDTSDTPAFGYGYGWYVGRDGYGRFAYHVGYLLGYKALVLRYPDRKTVFIVLSNLESVDADALRTSLPQRFFAPH